MLAQFRKFGATRTSKAMLILLTLSFGAWGIADYLVRGTGFSGVSVNGEDIAAVRLEENYKQRVDALSQMLGQKASPEELTQMRIAETVLNEAIARTILRQTAANLGLVAAVKQLQDEIAGNPIFHGDNGAFDPARYRSLLQRIGKTPEQFEAEMAKDLGVRLLGQTVRLDTVTSTVVAPLAALEKATLTLKIATVHPAQTGTIAPPTDTDLKTFYDLNPKLYSKPEKRSFNVLTLNRKAVAETIQIPESRAKQEYDSDPAAFAVPEKRVVRHILLDSEDKAKALVPQITSLADFEKVANANSSDPGNKGSGGMLGTIAKADVVPAFADVAFTQAPGTLSAPVKSPFGWHLIWVEKIEPARTRDFAEVKDELIASLQTNETEDALNRLFTTVDEKIAAGESVTNIAKEIGMQATPIALVTADAQGVEPEILQAGFSTEEGAISAPVTLKDGGAVYVQVTNITPESVTPLAEIKSQVAKDWTAMQTALATQRAADKVLSAARAPGQRDLAVSVGQSGVAGVPVDTLVVKDLEQVPEWLHQRMLDVYQLPEGALLPTAIKNGDSWHIVSLTKRELAKPTQAELESTAKTYQQRMQADVEALVVEYLQRTSDISCDQRNLKQIFGREVACE